MASIWYYTMALDNWYCAWMEAVAPIQARHALRSDHRNKRQEESDASLGPLTRLALRLNQAVLVQYEVIRLVQGDRIASNPCRTGSRKRSLAFMAV